LHFQTAWLAEERGVRIPEKTLEGFDELLDLARQIGMPFEDLCLEALNARAREEIEECSVVPEKQPEAPGDED
jgi:hypothetical protein